MGRGLDRRAGFPPTPNELQPAAFASQSERWEDRLGAFTGFTMTAPVHHPDAFIVSVIEHCMRFLEDREPRVR